MTSKMCFCCASCTYLYITGARKRHPHTYYIQLWSKVSSLACHGNLGLLKIYLTSSLFQGVIIVQHILTSLKTEMGAHVWIPFGFSLIYIRLNALLKKIKGTLSKHITSQRGKNMLDIHYWYGLDNVLPFFDQIKMFNLQWDRIQRHPENQTEKMVTATHSNEGENPWKTKEIIFIDWIGMLGDKWPTNATDQFSNLRSIS